MTQNSRMAKELSEDSFLLKGGPRSLTSGSPISPTSVMPMASIATMTNNPRQNPNPDIQDIITGIVKLLNGNVNVHANTQSTRRPVHTRINNRGPPRLSENPPSQLDYENMPTGSMRPPPYPFERPEGPARPFLTGVPIPEQIVPSMQQNYRPGFISQNRPPWQRPRPRPPVTNRRPFPSYKPIPMPEYRPEDEIQLTTSEYEGNTVEIPTDTKLDNNNYEVGENGFDYLPNEMPQEPFTKKEEVTKKKDKNPGKSTEKKSSIEPSSTISSIIESTTHIVPIITESESSLESSIEDSLTTISSSHSETTPIPSKIDDITTTEIQSTSLNIQSTSASSQNVIKSTESSSVPSFNDYHPRPGIVLDDPEFKPGGLARPSTQQPQIQQQQRPRPPVQPSRPNLPPGYGEIFDITLSAIQGPGSGSGSKQTVKIKPYGSYGTAPLPGSAAQGNYGGDVVTGAGTGNGDIIIAPTGDESFVSIDGKRTYIDLFGEPTAPPSTSATQQRPTVKPTQVVIPPGVTGTGYAVVETETINPQPKPAANRPPPHYRPRHPPQQPPVRIDTCIVGDDSTCDQTQNEKCKTDSGVSSCHCRPGFGRRKHREPCRKVVSLLMSLRVDKIYERRVIWDNKLAQENSEPYGQLSYEAIRAIDSAMSMTPFSDEFIEAHVNRIYNGNASQGAAGVFVNITLSVSFFFLPIFWILFTDFCFQLEESSETLRPSLKSDIQRHLLGVIHRRNNNIGNSALYVESPPGSVSNLQGLLKFQKFLNPKN